MSIQKCQVYLFEDIPLHVIVIDDKGKIVGDVLLQWNGQTLERFSEHEPHTVSSLKALVDEVLPPEAFAEKEEDI